MNSIAALHTGEVRAGRFDPEVFVICLQRPLGQNILFSPPQRVKLQYCMLNKFHVDSRNTAMSLYLINYIYV